MADPQDILGQQLEAAAESIADSAGAFQAAGSALVTAFRAGTAGTSFQNIATLTQSQMSAVFDQSMIRIADTLLGPVRVGLNAIINQQSDFTIDLANDLQDIMGMSVNAVMRIDANANTASKALVENAFQTVKNVASTEVLMADGSKRIIENYATSTEMFKNFTESALNDTRLYHAAAVGMNDTLLATTTEGIKSLGMTSAQVNEVLQRELSETGKITGETLNNQLKMIIATHQVAGTNIKRLTHDLGIMMADYTHFGEMSAPQMLSLSNALEKVGLSIDDVRSIASKFQNLDSAIQTVNNFAAATGAALDMTGLFEKANEGDMFGLLQLLKDNLEESGVEFESLNRQQKMMLANQLGIDPMVLKRVMSSNFENIEDITEQIEQGMTAITDKQRQEFMVNLTPIKVEDAQKQAEMLASLKNLSVETALNIEKSLSVVYGTTNEIARLTKTNIDDIAKNSKKLLEELEKFSEKFGKKLFSEDVAAAQASAAATAVQPSASVGPTTSPGATTPAPTPPAAVPVTPAATPTVAAVSADPAIQALQTQITTLQAQITALQTPPTQTGTGTPTPIDINLTLTAGPEFGKLVSIDNISTITPMVNGGQVYVKFVSSLANQVAP